MIDSVEMNCVCMGMEYTGAERARQFIEARQNEPSTNSKHSAQCPLVIAPYLARCEAFVCGRLPTIASNSN
jgi:hypothetical protein